MKRLHMLAVATLVGVAGLNFALPSPAAVAPIPAIVRPEAANELSVMTYNVEGLPFPVAYGRGGKVAEIGARLGDLRRTGRQPHIVLLQEAFIPEAKAIASAAGYAHVVMGPQIADATTAATRGDARLAESTSWLKGEGLGKWVDSGLVILSDYPIVRTRKMAFPEQLCAGFDCLAAKGVLLAWVQVPGRNSLIAIADTHLNSRKASGVGVKRANEAYLGQVAAVRGFIRANVPAGSAVIFGGDFNIGHDRTRIAAEAANGGIVEGGGEATQVAGNLPGGWQVGSDRTAILARAKDKQYFRAGSDGRLKLRNLEVPFGSANGGNGLSDHIGYVADYAF